jgi:hypothetical protein
MVLPLSPGPALSKIADELKNHKPTMVVSSFIRPNNTTAYTAGDIIYPAVPGGSLIQVKALQFKDALPFGGSGFISEAQLKIFSTQPTKLSADLHLFTAPLTAAPVDNDPWAIGAIGVNGANVSLADMTNHLKTISFPDTAGEVLGGFTMYEVMPSKIVNAASASTSLYGILVAKNAYVPIASEKFVIQLGILPRISVP